MTSKTVYSVNLWGSNPEDGNDDCWTGADFETLAEAEAVFADPSKQFTDRSSADDLAGHNHDVYVELATGSRDGERTFDVETVKVRKVAGRKGAYNRADNSDDEWRREQAMQAGMAFGCDGYNDVMGY